MSDRPTVRWFLARGKLHAEDPDKTATIGKMTAHCGLTPLDVAPDKIQNLSIDDVPEHPREFICMADLVWVGLQSIEEEPVEHARSRGLLPFESPEDLGNL